ncbi:hypothetical protein FIBSPDRAFT_897833, partial [Athelia psychrophila]
LLTASAWALAQINPHLNSNCLVPILIVGKLASTNLTIVLRQSMIVNVGLRGTTTQAQGLIMLMKAIRKIPESDPKCPGENGHIRVGRGRKVENSATQAAKLSERR